MTVVFPSGEDGVVPGHRREGPGAAQARLLPGAGPPIGRVDARNTVAAGVALHHSGFRVGRALTSGNFTHQLGRLTRRFTCIGFENSRPSSEPWSGSC
jgi:hypothetical protein